MTQNQRPKILNYLAPLIMISAGMLHYRKHGLDLITMVPIALGAFALYLVLFNFHLLQRVEKLLIKLWYPIGQLITIVLLTITFFAVFAPVGLVLRLFKKDIINGKFKLNQLSYWVSRSGREQNNYTQQF